MDRPLDLNNVPDLDPEVFEPVREVLSPQMMIELVGVLERTARETLSQLMADLENQSMDAARRSAHKLKGSAGNVGLKRISMTAACIESADNLAQAQKLAATIPDLLEKGLIVLKSKINN
jgi:HPt (histidine-containing phosphotransfer) domain-containing protein